LLRQMMYWPIMLARSLWLAWSVPSQREVPQRRELRLYHAVGNLGIRLTAVTPGASLAGIQVPRIPEECVMSICPPWGLRFTS